MQEREKLEKPRKNAQRKTHAKNAKKCGSAKTQHNAKSAKIEKNEREHCKQPQAALTMRNTAESEKSIKECEDCETTYGKFEAITHETLTFLAGSLKAKVWEWQKSAMGSITIRKRQKREERENARSPEKKRGKREKHENAQNAKRAENSKSAENAKSANHRKKA